MNPVLSWENSSMTNSKGDRKLTKFWPQGLNAKDYDPETREAIKFHEEIRQLTERVAELEAKK